MGLLHIVDEFNGIYLHSYFSLFLFTVTLGGSRWRSILRLDFRLAKFNGGVYWAGTRMGIKVELDRCDRNTTSVVVLGF